MRYVAITTSWALAFAIGYFVATSLVSAIYHRYDDHGIGTYYGRIHGTVQGFNLHSFLKFDGESSKTFRFAPPPTYTYDSLNLILIDTSDVAIQGKLHVPQMELVTKKETLFLSEDLLAGSLLGPEHAKHEDAETVNELYRLLQSAGSSAFPRPMHHPYQIPRFIAPEEGRKQKRQVGSILHCSCGYRTPHLPVYWTVFCVAGWIGHMLYRVITIRCTRSRGPRGFWKQ